MTRTSGSIGGGVTAAALARVGALVPAVEASSPTALLGWAAARGRMRSGIADSARIAFVGDSKTVGAGAGSGTNFTVGAFARSRPSRVAALLAAGGLATRSDSFFGCAGFGTIAEVLAYDPRRSGFSGWGGGGQFARRRDDERGQRQCRAVPARRRGRPLLGLHPQRH